MKIIWKILNNPVFGLIVGIAITLYFANRQETSIELAYTMVNQSRIATNEIDTNITILFKSDTVNNLNLAEFVTWNNGNTFIGNDLISTKSPLVIKATKPVKILSATIYKKSRDNLNITTYISQIGNRDFLLIKPMDDGFETKDGMAIQILYSGSENAEFYLDGRIKGDISPFRKIDPKELPQYTHTNLIGRLVSALVIIGVIVLIVVIVKAYIESKFTIQQGWHNIVPTVLFCCLFLYMLTRLCIVLFKIVLHANTLDWL